MDILSQGQIIGVGIEKNSKEKKNKHEEGNEEQ